MIGELANHLWQSTLFAVMAGLLTVAFRKNRAQVRYWLWFSASIKFFIPFALLMSLGSHLDWMPSARKTTTPIVLPAVSSAMLQISEPFVFEGVPSAPSTPRAIDRFDLAIIIIWTLGLAAIALMRLRAWQRIRMAVRTSTALQIPGLETPMRLAVRASPGLLEPGVVGLLHPILLLPADITDRLTPRQLRAVLAHEFCHVRRRDNLTSAIHMIVEAVFWFHPLVWWISARMVEERERACDEEVLRLGSEPQDYAEGILNVCKVYLESPLRCVSGVTGSDLKKRIHAILTGRVAGELNLARKLSLTVAGMTALALPIAIGVFHAPVIRAAQQPPAQTAIIQPAPAAPVLPEQAPLPSLTTQAQAKPVPAAVPKLAEPITPKFDVASIKPCQPGDGPGRGGGDMGANGGRDPNLPEGVGGYFSVSPGRLDVICGSILTMVSVAYIDSAGNPLLNNPAGPMRENETIQGVPKWALAARYTIHAETEDPVANQPTRIGEGRGSRTSPTALLLRGAMLQGLLEDRFHLKVHREVTEAAMYALTIAKSGLKLKPMQDGDCLPGGPPGWPSGGKPPCGWVGWEIHGPNRTLLGGGITLDRLARELGVLILDRNVIDRSGISVSFVFRLEYAPDETTRCFGPAQMCNVDATSDIPPAATIFAALEQQFGLKLESIKGPKEHIVIDRVEQPSQN